MALGVAGGEVERGKWQVVKVLATIPSLWMLPIVRTLDENLRPVIAEIVVLRRRSEIAVMLDVGLGDMKGHVVGEHN